MDKLDLKRNDVAEQKDDGKLGEDRAELMGQPAETQVSERESKRGEPILAGKLYTRQEAIDMLRVSPAFFSKLVNGKVKGLPPPPRVPMGEREFPDPSADLGNSI